MKHILKILFLTAALFIQSCEELEDGLPLNTDQFLGTWYGNQSMENYMNFTVNSNQTVVPVESQLSGLRALEGGIQVSGSGINYSLNYNFGLFGDMDDGFMLTNMSAMELLPLMFESEYGETTPPGLVLLSINEDSVMMVIDSSVYLGTADITWHLDFDDSLFFQNLDQNSNLSILSFNGFSSVSNVFDPSQSINLSGSIGFSSINLEANTPVDYFEFLFGMTMTEFMALSGESMGDDSLSSEFDLTLTINEDSTYSVIIPSSNTDIDIYTGQETTTTVYDTCSGIWTVSNNKIHVNASDEVCSDDDSNNDSEGSGNTYSNIEIGLKSNGNLELHMWNDSFCNNPLGEGFDGEDSNMPSEMDCKAEFETELMLAENSLSSLKVGGYFELSSTQNTNLFFNYKYFKSYFNRNMSKIRGEFDKKKDLVNIIDAK